MEPFRTESDKKVRTAHAKWVQNCVWMQTLQLVLRQNFTILKDKFPSKLFVDFLTTERFIGGKVVILTFQKYVYVFLFKVVSHYRPVENTLRKNQEKQIKIQLLD